MWGQIVGAMAILIVATFLLQVLLPRKTRSNRVSPRQYLMWDIAPLLGFLGIVLLGLSFLEATRRDVVYAWLGGSGAGLVASLGVWLASNYRSSGEHPTRLPVKKIPLLRRIWQLVTTYGLIIAALAIGGNLAIRWFGPPLEALLAAMLAVLLVCIAGLVFVKSAAST